MKAIKLSSKVDEATWNNLRELAQESHRSISGLLRRDAGLLESALYRPRTGHYEDLTAMATSSVCFRGSAPLPQGRRRTHPGSPISRLPVNKQ